MRKINLENKCILVTGAAGFIGSFLVKRICSEFPSCFVVGFDNMSDYYDVSLKEYRVHELDKFSNFRFIKGNLVDALFLDEVFTKYHFDIVVNLAAQAGVRYSIDHPDIYIESNIVGFYHILEACRHHPVEHLVFASSSSIYGDNEKVPFSEDDRVDEPVSLYAATKRSDELLAYTYSKLYSIPTTGLRFFTVYGPSGRPDMAYFDFTKRLIHDEKIKLFHYGKCARDFTYIDDIVEGIVRVMGASPEKEVPYSIYNIGNNHPENLLDFVSILKEELVRVGLLPKDFDLESHIELVATQPGDVLQTFADTSLLEKDFGYKPKTSLREGLSKFVDWYVLYYRGDHL